MKKLIKAAAVLTAAAFLGGTGTYGYFSDTLKVKNHISTGDINIGLKEYEKKGSTEVSFAGTKAVVPGDVISKIPRITNYASPCWVRARITYKNDRENMEGFSDKNISGMSKKWVQRGEYYYYTSILKRKDSTDLFKEVTVPETWTEEHTGQQLGITRQRQSRRQILIRILKQCRHGEIRRYSFVFMKRMVQLYAERKKQNCQWSLTDRLINFCLFRVTFL